ncbi:translocation/assembly module TamB domain-containing protein [Salinimicrobium oceani]|uniref:Translocation/assembly module TamB n=1 Tax=Salinimicrobium oceani TaxID=2722702 RepID=A0ABX1D3S5_9FLAO|nr:translocation/assembly module TamB [Salinimicrobium oceani]NJW53348.1 translocation/assembly module TamB [Salinimicrobium oceani]
MEAKNKKKEKKKKGSGLRLFLKILAGIFLFIILLLLFIRSPWGQGIIVDKIVSYISNKTNTTIEVDRLFITFGGDISLEGLYMEDEAGDTLVYSRKLEADIPLLPLIQGKGFHLRSLDWDGGIAKIKRQDTIEGFNFDFLTEAFATADTAAATTPVDTSAAAMEIRLGDMNIENFRLSYEDQYLGIDTKVTLGRLQVEMREFGLDSMKFAAGDALLENARFTYAQTKPAPDSQEEEEIPLPSFSVQNLELKNVAGTYKSVPDGIVADVNLPDLLLELPEADLENTSLVIDRLDLKNSKVYLQMSAVEAQEDTISSESAAAFEWPEWKVDAKNISIINSDIRYWVNDKRPIPGTFNPEAVGLQDLMLQMPRLELAGSSLNAEVERLNFTEASGLNLRKMNFELAINKEQILLQDFVLQLNDNYAEGRLLIDYNSLNAFIQNPETASLDLDLSQFHIDLSEIYRFQPDLMQNAYFSALAKKDLSGNVAARGEMAAVKIQRANINWGASTSLAATGTIYNATDPDNLRFDLPQVRMNSTRNDLRSFVKEEDLGIQLPQKVALTGSFSGSPEDLRAHAVLNSSSGKISVNGKFVSAPGIAFNADVKIEELALGEVLQNQALGTLSLQIEASGSGDDVNSLDAVVEGTINAFEYNEYQFKDIGLYAEMEEGEGFANLNYKDENLNMELESFVQLDSVAPEVALNLNIIGADLQALGLSINPVNTAMEIKGNFKGNAQSYDATATVSNGVFVYANESYLLGDVDLLAHVRPDTTAVAVQNQMLDLRLNSNAGPVDFFNALNRHYQSYYDSVDVSDTVTNPVNIDLRAQLSPSPILEEVFLPQLEAFDTINVKVDFREREKTLVGNVSVPYIHYFGSEVDSLNVNVDSNPEELYFNFGLKSLNAGPVAIKQTLMEGRLVDEELALDFVSNYEQDTLVNLKSRISRTDGVLRVHIAPEKLTLNGNPWEITPENEILIGEDYYTFNIFRLSRNNQELKVTNDMAGVQKEHIGIEFQNFNLAAIFSYLNPETILASGNMNGNLVIEEPFGSTGMVADLTIREFGVLEVPLGVLSLDAEAIGFNNYQFAMTVKEGNADIDLNGSYVADANGGNLDMQIDLNRVNMKLIEGFSFGAISNTSGSYSGNFTVTGQPLKPTYEGSLTFNDAMFTIDILNTPFTLPNETLQIDNAAVSMQDFEIRDVNGNSFTLNGAVLTESLLNPEFDLSFTANNFMALNSSEEDFDLFYGKAVFDATGSVTGNMELPQVELDLEILEATNLTYVIPEANLEIEEREGVVIFVNREDPDRILTRRTKEESNFGFSGFALNSYVSLQKGATFIIVLDEDTGDHFEASGDGDILYDIYPNGRTTMSGRVEINDGHYEMSLYNLVTRRFEILDGSSVVWAGDPMDADLNITASYAVEAAASGLMAPQITGADMDVRNQYRQELNFLVYLKIGGEISAPRLSFGLDMPEDEQGALSGQVYGRVQQLNQQENELNKQVFSLLVLNRFFPSAGSPGTEGGTLSFARDNLNEALSDQLNIFSDRLLGQTGVDLNFGLNSFTDYQGASPQDRTQLDITAEKTLLDDRLIVRVGSEVDVQGSSPVEESSPLIGNVSLEYLITEDGRFRVQGFRRNTFENVIDGQLIISGLALIYTQEFNKFRELWNQITNKEAKEEEEQSEE